MEKISTTALIKNSLRALLVPQKIFKEIPENKEIDYKTAFPFLFIFGTLTACFVYFPLTENRLFLSLPRQDFQYFLLIGFFHLLVWSISTCGFFVIGRIFKKNPSLRKIEIASFYIAFFMDILYFFDLPYLFGLPRSFVHIFGATAHFYWLFAFFYLIVFTYFLLQDVLGFSKRGRFYSLLLALATPIVGRYILENNIFYGSYLLSSPKLPVSPFTAGFLLWPTVPLTFALWIYFKEGKNLKVYAINSGAISLLYLIAASVLIFNVQIFNHISLGKVQSHYQVYRATALSNGQSRFTHSYTWTSSDYEPGTITHTAPGAGAWWSDDYQDQVDTDFDPTKTTVKEIRVKVHFASGTTVAVNGDGTEAQGCLAGDTNGGDGTFYCSNLWAASSGASNQTFTINSNNIRTYSSSSEGAAGTSANWNSLTAALTQNNNDVLVHSFTAEVCFQGCANDVISFDAVTVEIDYVTNLTQRTYQWYSNADSVQPGSSLASANTTISAVKRNDILRLRLSLQTQTGYMSVTTEAFRLQYGLKTGATCADISIPWADLSPPGTGVWAGYDNPTPSDGATITTSLLDGGTDALESYEEQNNSAYNPTGLDLTTTTGEWDWVIQDWSGLGSVNYCFRVIQLNGVPLNTYSNYPELTTNAVPGLNIKGKTNIKGKVNLN